VNAVRTLLDGIVDYAGLFPPAALDMPTAVRNYALYSKDTDAWMLGRFVVPIARLAELAAVMPVSPHRPWRLTALMGGDSEQDVRRVREFNASHRGRATVDVLEAKASSTEEIERIGAAVGGDFTTFVELPAAADLGQLLATIKRRGLCAKIRTGGVVADAFPSAALVARFIRACLRAGVPFKATAGLHHPVRASYRLTYDAAAPTGVMFGYLNVFLAAALMANGLSDEDAVRLLEERDADGFELRADSIGWRGHSLSGDAARRVREEVAVSFGSCSFREPVDELRALTLAPTQ
jgi:hypothetical protein